MREILFRAKAIDRDTGYHRTKYKNGDFVYGLVTRLYDERFPTLTAEMTDTNGVSGIEIDYKTIGQFTGLTDKNGKRIFEGDIIHYIDDYDDFDGFTRTVDEKAVIVWDKDYCGFACKIIGDESGNVYSWLDFSEKPDLVVIGNIHDNTELIGDAENE